jgi:hypothetical protein
MSGAVDGMCTTNNHIQGTWNSFFFNRQTLGMSQNHHFTVRGLSMTSFARNRIMREQKVCPLAPVCLHVRGTFCRVRTVEMNGYIL